MINWKDFQNVRLFKQLRFKKTAKITVEESGGTEFDMPFTRRKFVELSNAQLLALAATPVEVIPAPVAGKMHVVLSWRFRTIFNGTAMDDAAADGDLILRYAGADTIDTMQADGLIDAGANEQGLSQNLTELLVAESAADGAAVQISNDGAEFTAVGGGDSTAQVEVWYYTVDTAPSV